MRLARFLPTRWLPLQRRHKYRPLLQRLAVGSVLCDGFAEPRRRKLFGRIRHAPLQRQPGRQRIRLHGRPELRLRSRIVRSVQQRRQQFWSDRPESAEPRFGTADRQPENTVNFVDVLVNLLTLLDQGKCNAL